MRSLRKDERGIEPTIMKLLVGVVLVAIGLGIGVTMYKNLGNSASETLSYEVTTTPSADAIQKDNVKTVSVGVNALSNFEEEVKLSAYGVPEGVSVIFNPNSGEPDFGSTMEISVGSDAPEGTHTITVKGISSDTEKSATFDLTIE